MDNIENKLEQNTDNQPVCRGFYEFFKDSGIKIPIIQRDYAQGRSDKKAKEVREGLLKSVKDALYGNEKLDLNFAYGIEINDKDKPSVFCPVDGQQRLTTLYLIHYYFFTACKRTELKECKTFTYATRTSAQEFFEWLRESKSHKLADLITSRRNPAKPGKLPATTLEVAIKNMPEYQAAWNNDPTVDSAIRMLSDIEDFFSDCDLNTGCDRLMASDCPIYMSFIPEKTESDSTEAKNKSDKMYVRMNARGKGLTDFEILRASIDGIYKSIKGNGWDTNLIENYDREYLDHMYDRMQKLFPMDGLRERTKRLNWISENILKNVYDIVCLSFENLNFEHKSNRSDYRYYVHELGKKSQNDPSLQIYLDAVDSYLKYCKEINSEYKQPIFTTDTEEANNAYSADAVDVLYCYFYKKIKNAVPDEEKTDLIKYVLKNLDVNSWTNVYPVLKSLCEKIAECNDVYDYFVKTGFGDICKIFACCGLSDIKVRIKEQKIKAQLINNKNLDPYFFDKYEEASGCRKLQFVLYVAGFWKSGDKSNFEGLNDYLESMKAWIIDGNRKFRIRYALVAYTDGNGMKAVSDIDQQCDNKHIWNNDVCFWNDTEESDGSWESHGCKQAKAAYIMTKQEVENKKSVLNTDASFENCWLKYAVLNEFDDNCELLKREISRKNNETYILADESRAREFYLYYYKLFDEQVNKGKLYWGDEKIQWLFGNGINIDAMSLWSTNWSLCNIQGEHKLLNGSTEWIDRTYNVTLVANKSSSLKTNPGKIREQYLYKCENKDGNWILSRYYVESTHIKLERFDITDKVNELDHAIDVESNFMKGLKKPDDYFALYYFNRYGSQVPVSDQHIYSYAKKVPRERNWYFDDVLKNAQMQPLPGADIYLTLK